MGKVAAAAARWLADHAPDQAAVYKQRNNLVEALTETTGASRVEVETVLAQDWSAIVQSWRQLRSDGGSRTDWQKAGGGAGAQLAAGEFQAEQLAGVRIRAGVDLSGLPEHVLARTSATDRKGRGYATPRNPAMPPLEVFKPRLAEIRAGALASVITGRRHGIDERQAASMAALDDDALAKFRMDDPISAIVIDGGLSLTDGHHRTNEIIERVRAGKMSPDAVVEVLLHE